MRFAFVLGLVASSLSASAAEPALAEVNAYRAKRGLRPFVEDPGLTQAAMATADYRAARRMFGHTTGGAGDFRFLPAGVRADSAGCAAYPDSYGWMSCCADDNYRYAGAAWARGADGKRYMHLFVRNSAPSTVVSTQTVTRTTVEAPPVRTASASSFSMFTTAPRRPILSRVFRR